MLSVEAIFERYQAIRPRMPAVSAGLGQSREIASLLDIADGLEKRTSRQLELFVRLLEPVMLLFMAGVVLLIVSALLMPIFKMSSAIG